MADRPTGKWAQRGSPRDRTLGYVVIGLGLIVLGLAAWVALPQEKAPWAAEEPSAIPLAVKRPAPALALTGLGGEAVSLEDHAGQVILVNNWATWCPPCRAEMPTLEAYYQEYRDRGFTIIAIDAGDPPGEVTRFVQVMGLSFPVWLDRDGRAMAAFGSPGLPSSYVIDRTGMIRLAWTGAISRAVLERHVTPLLDEG